MSNFKESNLLLVPSTDLTNEPIIENKIYEIDFKDIDLLKRFQTEGGKILPRRITGNCFIHQKKLAAAIKRARILAFIL